MLDLILVILKFLFQNEGFSSLPALLSPPRLTPSPPSIAITTLNSIPSSVPQGPTKKWIQLPPSPSFENQIPILVSQSGETIPRSDQWAHAEASHMHTMLGCRVVH